MAQGNDGNPISVFLGKGRYVELEPDMVWSLATTLFGVLIESKGLTIDAGDEEDE